MKVAIIGCGSVGKTAVVILASGIMMSCGTHKKTLDSQKQTTVIVQENLKVESDSSVTNTKETEKVHYGDTLQGNFPIPELTDKPLKVQVESGGQTLDLTIDKSGVSYKAISKPTSTTKTKEVQEHKKQQKVTKETEKSGTSTEAVTTKNEREQWKIPFWLIATIIIIIILVGSYFLKPIKNFLKPFKIFKR